MPERAKRDPRRAEPTGKPRRPKFNSIPDPHNVAIRMPGAWVRNLDEWCHTHQITTPAFMRKAIFDAMVRLGVSTE